MKNGRGRLIGPPAIRRGKIGRVRRRQSFVLSGRRDSVARMPKKAALGESRRDNGVTAVITGSRCSGRQVDGRRRRTKWRRFFRQLIGLLINWLPVSPSFGLTPLVLFTFSK